MALVSFPHYFLQAEGQLAEQLKTKEWIVARITLITERVVDHKVGPLVGNYANSPNRSYRIR